MVAILVRFLPLVLGMHPHGWIVWTHSLGGQISKVLQSNRDLDPQCEPDSTTVGCFVAILEKAFSFVEQKNFYRRLCHRNWRAVTFLDPCGCSKFRDTSISYLHQACHHQDG